MDAEALERSKVCWCPWKRKTVKAGQWDQTFYITTYV